MKSFQKFFLVLAVLSFVTLCILFQSNIIEIVQLKSEVSKSVCGRLPQEEHITIDNIIWQVLAIPKGFYMLMNAYLDERYNETLVRVSVIGKPIYIQNDEIYCQFWFDELPETQPTVVKATEYFTMFPRSKFL
jgi:hypothetical protein